jgi:hypothetical protein
MTDAAYDPSDDAPSPDPEGADTGPGSVALKVPPLWAFDAGPQGGFQPTGDPLKDSITQALRYHIGRDDVRDASDDQRPMMRSLGLAPVGPAGGFPVQISDDDDSPWRASALKARGGTLQNAGFNPGNYTQTGGWSDPSRPASPGQHGSAWDGAHAIQHAYVSGGGQTYVVDPKTMGMEGSIDIGQQIRDSINAGGYMRPIYDQAVQSGKPVAFDSAGWGLRRFENKNKLDPDGQTVGRWGGAVTGVLSATPDGRWSVGGNVQPVKTGLFNYHGDATGDSLSKFLGNVEIGGAGSIPDVYNRWNPNHIGTSMPIEFNRKYKFNSTGKLYDLKQKTNQ